MPQEITAYCPQCLLLVFAAMGVYQYVIRDRIVNGPDVDDDLLDTDIDEMDDATRAMLLEVLTNDHLRDTSKDDRISA